MKSKKEANDLVITKPVKILATVLSVQKEDSGAITLIAKRCDIKHSDDVEEVGMFNIKGMMSQGMQQAMIVQEKMMPSIRMLRPDIIKIPLTDEELESLGEVIVGRTVITVSLNVDDEHGSHK